MRTIKELARPGILALKPYSSARDEFTGEAQVYLDANENPNFNGLNRYPDPHQRKLKQRIGEIKGIAPNQIFLGNGSDEAIDLVFRAFCEPNQDRVIICPPTYGMYKVSAEINQVGIVEVPLDENFQLQVDQILAAQSPNTKMVFICSPNNPTGNLLHEKDIEQLLNSFDGLVVVDEAYIDFADQASWITKIDQYSNLLVLQTFSKAWGLAGLRLGMALGQPEIIGLLSKIKPPYNLNTITQQTALEILAKPERTTQQVAEILDERKKMTDDLKGLSGVHKVYNSDANFILAKVTDADAIYNEMIGKGIILRNRSKVASCENCLRITVGTPKENQQVIKELKSILGS